MKYLKLALAAGLLLVVALALVWQNSTHSDAALVKWPVLRGDPTTPLADYAAIRETIARADRVRFDADWGGHDYAQFATVFADDPSVPLFDNQRKYIKLVREAHGDAYKSLLQGDGFLTYQIAGQLDSKKADQNAAEVLATVTAQGRDGEHLTADEKRMLQAGVIRDVTPFAIPTPTKPAYRNPLYDFKSIIFQGNYADVTYDNGAALFRAFMVKTAAGWRIAGRIVLYAHA